MAFQDFDDEEGFDDFDDGLGFDNDFDDGFDDGLGFDDDFDDGFDDDSFDDGFDDDSFEDSATTLSPEKKAEFDRQLNEKLKALGKKSEASPKERIEAVKWLGESGDPTAIKALVFRYKKDPDDKVKKAAAESLGKFKALGEALNSTDLEKQNKAYDRIENIVYREGVQTGGGSGRLVILMVVLVVALGVLAVLNISMDDGFNISFEAFQDAPTPAPYRQPVLQNVDDKPASEVQTELDDLYSQLQTDINTFIARMGVISAGDDLDCGISYNNPDYYDYPANISRDYPLLTDVINKYNNTIDQVDRVRQQVEEACTEGSTLNISVEIAQDNQNLLTGLLTGDFATIPGILSDPMAIATPIATNTPVNTNTPVATATLDVTVTPTPTPTVDPNFEQTQRQVSDGLRFTIESMLDVRGPTGLLNQHWLDAQNEGFTLGCRDGKPDFAPIFEIRADQQEYVNQIPELRAAVNSTNLGLALTNDAWDLFIQSCNAGTMQQNAARGLAALEAARTGFANAMTSLDQLEGFTGGS